jgi:hypothetical protein
MKGTLPDEVISRKKTPLTADPVQERARALSYRYPAPRASERLAAFVEPGALPVGLAGRRNEYYEDLRLFALDQWLACPSMGDEPCDRNVDAVSFAP